MEVNKHAVDAIFKEHCWRQGKTRKAANNPASRDVCGLSVEERAEIEEIKWQKLHLEDKEDLL